MGFSYGLHVAHDYDLPAMMASKDMEQIYETVLQVRHAGDDETGRSSWPMLASLAATVRRGVHDRLPLAAARNKHQPRPRAGMPQARRGTGRVLPG